jgi:hypothetical protein
MTRDGPRSRTKHGLEERFAGRLALGGLLGRLALCLTLLEELLVPASELRVGVQAEEDAAITKRVLVLRPRALLDLGARGADDRLNLGRVDKTSDVRVRDLGRREAADTMNHA